MNRMINLILNICDAMKDYDHSETEEIIDMAVLDLLKDFCKAELNLTGYYAVDIEDDHKLAAGWFQPLFGNRISITDSYTRYTKAIKEQHYELLRDYIRTMLHEFRHAWQFNGGMEWPTEYTNGMNGDMDIYFNQPIEVDARDWSIRFEDKAHQYIAENLLNKILED